MGREKYSVYRMGIIAEILNHQELLKQCIKKYIVNQRIEKVDGDEEEIWHIYELEIPENVFVNIIEVLKDDLKETWYIHAFDEHVLYVIMKGKYFRISKQNDESWNEMLEYGRTIAKIEDCYLTSIRCDI